ncbi:MAG: hypothetical protein K6G42_00500 [Lachnospiraceae bacterium]|nr:hypothetical protein [Lachnospiraceae bacterium]
MGDVFYKELKQVSKDILSKKGKTKEAGNRALLETSREILDVAFVVRREGLPVLEAFTHKIKDKSIAAMLMYAIDGTSTEILEDICWSKYYASELKGYDALIYMLWLKSILSMQEGENPIVISERIKAMLPAEILENFEEIFAETQGKAMLPFSGTVDMYTVDRIIHEEKIYDPNSEGYILMKLADRIINEDINKEDLRILFKDIDRKTIATAMIGFNSTTRKTIFQSMSEEDAVTTAGDIEYMGPLLKKHITEAALEIFTAAGQMLEEGSISGDDTLLKIILPDEPKD